VNWRILKIETERTKKDKNFSVCFSKEHAVLHFFIEHENNEGNNHYYY